MPLLQALCDIAIPSGVIQAATTDSNYLYTINSSPAYAVYNWQGSLQNSATTVSLAATAEDIALVTLTGSSAIVYNSARVSIVDSLNNKTDITTNALAVGNIDTNEQIAGATDLQLALSTTSTAGKLCKIDPIAQTITQISPAALAATTARCIIYKSDAQTWLVGTHAGTIFEVNSAGTVQGSTLTLPNSPNVSAPTINVTGLSYYNSRLAIMDNYGNLYIYYWPTRTQITKLPVSCNAIGGINNSFAANLTASASGVCLVLPAISPTTGIVPTSELWFNTVSGGGPTLIPFYNEQTNGPLDGGIQGTINSSLESRAWITFNNGVNTGAQLRIYKITPPRTSTETTRFQSTIGVDVGSRCIRIRDDGIGKTSVEVDQNVSSGAQSLPCTAGHDYIELNIVSGSPNTWDIREFMT